MILSKLVVIILDQHSHFATDALQALPSARPANQHQDRRRAGDWIRRSPELRAIARDGAGETTRPLE
jgi:hypothetical protein